jgi:hypothetical protein
MMQTTLRPSSIGALRDRLRARWTELTDEDIELAGGSLDRLIQRIHDRTGETRPAIKRELRRILAA